MIYEYTETNQFEKPRSYMYSQFGGWDFIHGYRADRLERLEALSSLLTETRNVYEASAQVFLGDFLVRERVVIPEVIDPSSCHEAVVGLYAPEPQFTFSLNETVETTKLMDQLLYGFANEEAMQGAHFAESLWLDRLVQRFEVTKRIWSRYLPGFRKGGGVEFDVSLYRRFALLLALAYARSEELRYLSTLLKVDDLLLSLPIEFHADDAYRSLALAVAVELDAVRKLTSTFLEL